MRPDARQILQLRLLRCHARRHRLESLRRETLGTHVAGILLRSSETALGETVSSQQNKLWGGRFSDVTHPDVEAFTASVRYDRRLYRQDIAGSIAHARMLHSVGVLSDHEFESILSGLTDILHQIESGRFQWSDELEDVHMNIEMRLTEQIGDAGKKLHTGRSRNDQVATDLRLYARESTDRIGSQIAALQSALLDFAEREAETVMPGYTHLQVAQPVTFGHHLMAWFEMLDRDRARFNDARRRLNSSPLGAAALAGTTIPIDREATRAELGFDALCRNSLDAVSDRDFVIEIASACAQTMVHFSRMCEEIVIWASEAYGLIRLSDAFTTGSSIMPQKRNPDVAELVRGKSARVAGHLQSLLMLMKGQPLAYNRDNQEDKEAFFDCLDTAGDSIKMMHGMILDIRPQRERMLQAARDGYSTATDLAEFLAKAQVPFREAHEIVGRIVRHCVERKCRLEELSLETLQSFAPVLDESIAEALKPAVAVAARDHAGGTAPAQVRAAVAEGRERLNN